MSRYKVHLVVDREYGTRTSLLPEGEPVWIVDTPVNQKAVAAMWREKPRVTHLTGITMFADSPTQPPEDVVLRILTDIDLHHGPFSASPPYDAVHVIGAIRSPRLLGTAEAFGLTQVVGNDLDFELQKPEHAEPSTPANAG